MNAKEKILCILDYKDMNAATLATLLNVSSQALYDIMNGKTNQLSPRLKAKIKQTFPEISPIWLTRGEGAMITNSKGVIQQGDNNINGSNINSQNMEAAFLDEIREQRKLTEKAQEQISELITVIKDMQKNK